MSVFSQKLLFEKSKSQANRQIIKNLKSTKNKTNSTGKMNKNYKTETSLKRILQINSSNNTGFFTPLDYFYLDKIPALVQSAQRIKPQNVRSLKALQLTQDSKGFICPFQVGNIGSAGKIVSLVEGVIASYGRLKYTVNDLLITIKEFSTTVDCDGLKIIINNIITKLKVSRSIDKKKFVKRIKGIWPFYEIVFYKDFCCINMCSGILMKQINGTYMRRKEMEWFLTEEELKRHDNDIHMGKFAKRRASLQRPVQ